MHDDTFGNIGATISQEARKMQQAVGSTTRGSTKGSTMSKEEQKLEKVVKLMIEVKEDEKWYWKDEDAGNKKCAKVGNIFGDLYAYATRQAEKYPYNSPLQKFWAEVRYDFDCSTPDFGDDIKPLLKATQELSRSFAKKLTEASKQHKDWADKEKAAKAEKAKAEKAAAKAAAKPAAVKNDTFPVGSPPVTATKKTA